MDQKTWYKQKPDRSMVANDTASAGEALRKDGWVDKKPQGFKVPEVVTEATVESLRKEKEELRGMVEELSGANDGLISTNKDLTERVAELEKAAEPKGDKKGKGD